MLPNLLNKNTYLVSSSAILRPLCVAFLLAPFVSVRASEPLDCLIEPHLVVEVSSSEIGILDSVNVDEADFVNAGDVIAALRTDVESADLAVVLARAQVKSDIELLRREHDFNSRKRDRLDQLRLQNIVSVQDIDEIRTGEETSRLRLESAAERRRATELEAYRNKLALARRIVQSPIDGFVVKKHKSAGEFVDAHPIVELAQLNPLRIELVVPISMYGKVQVGMQATVVPELPIDGSFIASVVSIDPIMDAATATFGVRLSLPNPDHRLPAGLKCTLSLYVSEDKTPKHDEAADSGGIPESNTGDVIDSQKPAPSLAAAKEVSTNKKTALPLLRMPVAPTSSLTVETAGRVKIQRNATVRIDEQAIHEALLTDDAITASPFFSNVRSACTQTVRDTTDGPWTVLSRQSGFQPDALDARLKSAGVNDFQWIRRGPWEGRFSYGHYRILQNANNRLSEMQALGFKAELVSNGNAEYSSGLGLTTGPADSVNLLSQEVANIPVAGQAEAPTEYPRQFEQ